MKIQHNISALNTHRNLNFNNTNANKALEKLSSGYKVNRAGDDAAGLAISEKMRSQIRGLDMATKNAQDSISLIQTAEGAMNEVHSLLQRGRELAVQAANDTNVADDRDAIQKEIEQIQDEIDRIGTDTEFNTIKVLQGSGTKGTAGVDLNKLTAQINDYLEGAEQAVLDTYEIQPSPVKEMTMQFVNQEKGGSLAWVTSSYNSVTGIANKWSMTFDTLDYTGDPSQEESLALTTLHEMTHAMMSASGINWSDTANPTWFKEGTAEYMTGGMDRLVNDLKRNRGTDAFDSDNNILEMVKRIDGASDNTEFYSASYATTRYLDDWLKGKSTDLKSVLKEMQTSKGTLDSAIQAVAGGATLANFMTDLKDPTKGIAKIKEYITLGGIGSATGKTTDAALVASIKGQAINPNDNFTYNWGDKKNAPDMLQLQIGANEGQVMKLGLPNISAATIGIQGVNITTQQSAGEAIKKFDNSIKFVSDERTSLGAIQNRLEHTINNLGSASENLTAAESRIRDTDMAKEMMNFTKQNILMQAAQSMLAQANQQPQGVLQLLG